MFEHLDDPAPYAPPARLRVAVQRQVRRRHRRRVAVAGGVASLAVLGVGSVAAVRARLEPERVAVAGLAAEPGAVADDPAEPVTVLVVGTDDADEQEGTGVAAPGLTDTIALVRIDPAAGEVRALTIPRDLVLDRVPDGGRINGVLSERGASALVRLIDDELGIPIDHYAQVDLAGAVAVVDALGGIRVEVDRPMRDPSTGTELGVGCQALGGAETVGLGRARHVEVQQPDGTWRQDPTSELGRQVRGAAIAAALLRSAGHVGPSDLPELIVTGFASITVDDSLERDDVERWATVTRDDRFVPLGLPVVDVITEGRAVLHLGEGADAVVAAFLDGGTDAVPAVLDGTPVAEATGLRPC